jgi:hypothetical protein
MAKDHKRNILIDHMSHCPRCNYPDEEREEPKPTSAALLEFMPQFWESSEGAQWLSQLRAFLGYFVQRDPDQQLEILNGPIKTGDFARHTRGGESRERLREAFNTPLYPMILIANEVMQEGLDLHKQCRRIVHHDLV